MSKIFQVFNEILSISARSSNTFGFGNSRRVEIIGAFIMYTHIDTVDNSIIYNYYPIIAKKWPNDGFSPADASLFIYENNKFNAQKFIQFKNVEEYGKNYLKHVDVFPKTYTPSPYHNCGLITYENKKSAVKAMTYDYIINNRKPILTHVDVSSLKFKQIKDIDVEYYLNKLEQHTDTQQSQFLKKMITTNNHTIGGVNDSTITLDYLKDVAQKCHDDNHIINTLYPQNTFVNICDQQWELVFNKQTNNCTFVCNSQGRFEIIDIFDTIVNNPENEIMQQIDLILKQGETIQLEVVNELGELIYKTYTNILDGYEQ